MPPDVLDAAQARLREGWRKYVARRVHGAPERAIALVALPQRAPFALLFDGRSLEVASEAGSAREAGEALAAMPVTGMLMRQGSVAIWRESLSEDQAAARWRAFGGDEAFALPPPRHARSSASDALHAYALVRRGADQARVELSTHLDLAQATRTWATRYAAYLRPDLRVLLGPAS